MSDERPRKRTRYEDVQDRCQKEYVEDGKTKTTNLLLELFDRCSKAELKSVLDDIHPSELDWFNASTNDRLRHKETFAHANAPVLAGWILDHFGDKGLFDQLAPLLSVYPWGIQLLKQYIKRHQPDLSQVFPEWFKDEKAFKQNKDLLLVATKRNQFLNLRVPRLYLTEWDEELWAEKMDDQMYRHVRITMLELERLGLIADVLHLVAEYAGFQGYCVRYITDLSNLCYLPYRLSVERVHCLECPFKLAFVGDNPDELNEKDREE